MKSYKMMCVENEKSTSSIVTVPKSKTVIELIADFNSENPNKTLIDVKEVLKNGKALGSTVITKASPSQMDNLDSVLSGSSLYFSGHESTIIIDFSEYHYLVDTANDEDEDGVKLLEKYKTVLLSADIDVDSLLDSEIDLVQVHIG